MSHETTRLAHRGNLDGANLDRENGLGALRAALEAGCGLEVDIRRSPHGRFYLSHDACPWSPARDADALCALLRRHPSAEVALNVKELGYEAELIGYLTRQHVIDRCVLFDMELLEPTPGDTARTFRRLHPTVRLAARVSDRGESIDQALAIEAASVIWLDEFDRPWAVGHDIHRLVSAGKRVWAVSPDLHGFPLAQARARWADFLDWGVSGICTDYPRELASCLAERASEAVA